MRGTISTKKFTAWMTTANTSKGYWKKSGKTSEKKTSKSSPWKSNCMTNAPLSREKTVIPSIHDPNGIVYQDEEIAEAFFDTMGNKCGLNEFEGDDDYNTETVNYTNREIQNKAPTSGAIKPTSLKKLLVIVNNLKPTNAMIKSLPKKAFCNLLKINNSIAQFADDTAPETSLRNTGVIQRRLQTAMDDIRKWCVKW